MLTFCATFMIYLAIRPFLISFHIVASSICHYFIIYISTLISAGFTFIKKRCAFLTWYIFLWHFSRFLRCIATIFALYLYYFSNLYLCISSQSARFHVCWRSAIRAKAMATSFLRLLGHAFLMIFWFLFSTRIRRSEQLFNMMISHNIDEEMIRQLLLSDISKIRFHTAYTFDIFRFTIQLRIDSMWKTITANLHYFISSLITSEAGFCISLI